MSAMEACHCNREAKWVTGPGHRIDVACSFSYGWIGSHAHIRAEMKSLDVCRFRKGDRKVGFKFSEELHESLDAIAFSFVKSTIRSRRVEAHCLNVNEAAANRGNCLPLHALKNMGSQM